MDSDMICQSCGMLVGAPKNWGTQTDGGRSGEYCIRCFRGGSFADPDMTMEQMQENVQKFLAEELCFSEEDVAEVVNRIARLRRWK